ncbi:hypothetical protein JB92DRAFT_3093904 [Gautieria morchelliformis]|nr:hypothetical protein JB92DRAFT_3093904 [Gautieria morchelliformis]
MACRSTYLCLSSHSKEIATQAAKTKSTSQTSPGCLIAKSRRAGGRTDRPLGSRLCWRSTQ